MENNTYEENQPKCPCCGRSENVEEISQTEKDFALGAYQIFNIPQQLHVMSNKYRCENCGYEWPNS